jgi:hypothetical protein
MSGTKQRHMNISAIAVLAAIAVLMAAPAYAYVDPGTGGMLIQLVTGGVAGLLVLARLYWSRIKETFAGRRQSSDEAAKGGTSGVSAAENDPV